MVDTLVLTVTIVVVIWYILQRPFNYWTRLGVTQSKPWILFGDTWRFIFKKSSMSDFTSVLYNMHPGKRYIGCYSFSKPVLLLRDPELIKQLTVKDFEYFPDRTPLVDPDVDPLFNNALLNLRGERWKEMRNILSPTFTSSKIKSMYTLILETAETFVSHILEKENDIVEFNMKDSFSRFANDIIATTAFGVKVNSLKDPRNTFYEMGKKLTEGRGVLDIIKLFGYQAFPTLFKYLDAPFFNRDASKYFYGVIDDTIKVREEQNIIRHDMIHLMLEARKDIKGNRETGKAKAPVTISNKDIASQSTIFLFAGFDTVSTALSFGSYELALNKDIQDRLRVEINKTHKDGKVTYDELMEMKYMDMVISEILRKWPPFSLLDRISNKPYTIQPIDADEKLLQLPEKREIWLPVYGLHRDTKYFPDPEKFDPERFSYENKNNIVPYTYMPFGVGPRLCIGNRFASLEIKAMFFNLLLNYEIVPTKKTQIPLVLAKDFSMVPEGGIWLGLKRIRV